MGVNIDASSRALPTSRLVGYLQRRRNGSHDEGRACDEPSQARKGGSTPLQAKVWAAARLASDMADEWYRQLLSWAYQAFGYIVIYDRHYLFDFSLDGVGFDQQSFDRRIHRWFLTRLYPRPDLVIYLDAPAEALFARKGEKSIKELDQRRRAYIQQGRRTSNFVLIDATPPLPEVYKQVARCILEFCQAGQCQSERKQQENVGA